MSLDDQNRLRCITQTQKILKNQSSYLTLLDGISPQCPYTFYRRALVKKGFKLKSVI